MPVRIVLEAIAAVLLVLALGWVQYLRQDNAQLQQANTALESRVLGLQEVRKAEAKQAKAHIQKLQKLQQGREVNHAELGKATAESPDWAGERVPDSVARALGL